MDNQKKYGLFFAICMIIGIVIGSGIFFKADDILLQVGGSYVLGTLAWIIGGLTVVFGGLTILQYSKKIVKANGMIDYFEYLVNDGGEETKKSKFIGFIVGWFQAIVYLPSLVIVLSWVTALYTAILLGKDNPEGGSFTIIMSFVYMLIIWAISVFARPIASKLQVSTTIIKLIPILFMAIVGTIYGLTSDTVVQFGVGDGITKSSVNFAAALVATAFAYEGWIIATQVNDELKNPKKDLPKALAIGTILVVIIYVLYFTGVIFSGGTANVIDNGDGAVVNSLTNIIGSKAGNILTVFIIISCIGTLNGLTMANTRIHYQLGIRNTGIAPKFTSQLLGEGKAPLNSGLIALAIQVPFLIIWLGNFLGWYGDGVFLDLSSVPIVTNYVFYTILYIAVIVKFKDTNPFVRFIFPLLALPGTIIVIYGATQVDYLIGLTLVMWLIAIVGILIESAKLSKENY